MTITDEVLSAYLDGHVDPDQIRRIEAAVSSDPGLRARLERLQATDRDLRAAFDALLDPLVPDRLAGLVRGARVESREARDNVVTLAERRGQGRGLGAAWAAATNPRWLGWAAAAGFALLFVGAVGVQAPPPISPPATAAPAYHALGSAPEPAAANLMVIFKPQTPESDFRLALRGVDAAVVGGPTSTAAWLLHVPSVTRAAALATLKARADVELAEPIDQAGAPPQ